jgi:hypothetical protein
MAFFDDGDTPFDMMSALSSAINGGRNRQASIEKSIAERIAEGHGVKLIRDAFDLYQAGNEPEEVSYGGGLFASLIKMGLAKEIAEDDKIIQQAISYFRRDKTVDEATNVLIPLAEKGQSARIVALYPEVFDRLAELLASGDNSLMTQASALTSSMAQDKQADAIVRHSGLLSAIVQVYSDDTPYSVNENDRPLEPTRLVFFKIVSDDPDANLDALLANLSEVMSSLPNERLDDPTDKVTLGGYLLATLVKNETGSTVVKNEDVLAKTREYLCDSGVGDNTRRCAIALANTIVEHSDNEFAAMRYFTLKRSGNGVLRGFWDLLHKPRR